MSTLSPIPIRGFFTDLSCIDDTTEANDDEPYVILATIDLHGPIPTFSTNRTIVFEDDRSMDDGDIRHGPRAQIWPNAGTSTKAITDPNMVVFLVGLMENDSSKPDAVRASVQSILTASLTNYFPLFAQKKLKRSEMVNMLLSDMKGALELGAASGGIDMDELIGPPQELRLTPFDVGTAVKSKLTKSLVFSGDGAQYKVWFEFNK